ncbi:MAG: VOC family protein [Verrucomicrobia bacterium]|nr:VOC family protein [Verrucomicrobiota bacterium]MBV9671638.1 VOC family protein [Verrucomicrobiota bacterium]
MLSFLMSSAAVNHIAFFCRDVAAQEEFFCKHFGFQRSRTFNAGQPNEFIMLRLGSVRLELFPTDPVKAAENKGGEQPIGFRHLAFDVEKLEPAIQSLREEGIEPDPIIDNRKVIPGSRIVFFRDHEGNIIELMEGYRDEK